MNRPTILLYDTENDMVGLALMLKDEKYPFIYSNLGKEDKNKNIGKGLFDKEWSEHVWRFILTYKPEDLIIVTPDNGMPHQFEFLKKHGYKIIGEGEFANKFEYKRSAGTKLFEDLGFEVPDTKVFNSVSSTISFLEGQDPKKRFVIKPEGSSFAGGAKTYSGRDVDDCILFLKWLRDDMERQRYTIETIDIQEFIDGYEADFSKWFNGEDYFKGTCVDIEEKGAGDGAGKGMALGCAVNVVSYFKESKFDIYFDKLRPYLKRVGYVGDVAINCIFDKKTGMPRPLEWTIRMGWDSFPTEMIMHKLNGKKVSDFLLDLILKRPHSYPFGQIGIGVRISCMSPAIEKKEIEGRFFTFENAIKDNFYMYCVSKKEEYYSVEDNAVGCMVAVGKTIQGTAEKLYNEICPKLYLPDAFYRSTYPKRTEDTFKFLYKHKWL